MIAERSTPPINGKKEKKQKNYRNCFYHTLFSTCVVKYTKISSTTINDNRCDVRNSYALKRKNSKKTIFFLNTTGITEKNI